MVSTVIDRTPAEVWADIRDIETHVTWMAEAVGIRFVSEQREGVGTRFECDTRVGPIRLTDVMEVTAWEEAQRMGVRHVGLITGSGDLLLSPTGDGSTSFTWDEELSFPWWLGGPLGETAGRPLLRWIWNGNLRRLKQRLESDGARHPPG
jgi:hypothetical protein